MAAGPASNRSDLFPASPPAISLLTVPGVLVPEALRDERWINGISVDPEACNVSLDAETATADFPYWWEACGAATLPTEASIASKVIGTNPANIDAEAWFAWVGFACTAAQVATMADEVDARLRRKLQACLPSIVERELWSGQVATLQGASTPFLAEDGAVDEVSVSLGYITALAELEQALAECTCGRRHMIHAQPRLVTLWRSEDLVSLAPSRDHLLTELGTVVVPGTGYPGTSPTGLASSYSHTWAYGTGMVRVFTGRVTTTTADSSAVSRPTNDAEVRAETPVLSVFDPCCLVGVGVNLCDATCSGGS